MIVLLVYLAGAAGLAALGFGSLAAFLLALLGVAVVLTPARRPNGSFGLRSW